MSEFFYFSFIFFFISRKYYPRSFIFAYSKVTYTLLLVLFISSHFCSMSSHQHAVFPGSSEGDGLPSLPEEVTGGRSLSYPKLWQHHHSTMEETGSIWTRICQGSHALNLFSLITFSFIFIRIYSSSFLFHENLVSVHKPRVRPMLLIN